MGLWLVLILLIAEGQWPFGHGAQISQKLRHEVTLICQYARQCRSVLYTKNGVKRRNAETTRVFIDDFAKNAETTPKHAETTPK